MREICEISVADTRPGMDGNKVAGRFILDGNKLTYELAGGTDLMFKRILAEDIPVCVDGEMIELNSETQPNFWFEALPYHFARSAYMSARMVT